MIVRHSVVGLDSETVVCVAVCGVYVVGVARVCVVVGVARVCAVVVVVAAV